MSKFETFAALHVPGDPLILYNAWDAGSAKAAERAGAKAVATGSWSVADAHGFGDGEGLPLDLTIANAERMVGATELPVTIDFEGGYAVEPEAVASNVVRLAATGAIGCNFEDQIVGDEGLHPTAFQADRIQTIRAAVGADFFVNARTDMFLKAKPDSHDAAMVDKAIERAHAYADAGASGFFAPGLVDPALIERLTKASPLPVNVMWWVGVPDRRTLASAGVARISHGPGPYRAAMATYEAGLRSAME